MRMRSVAVVRATRPLSTRFEQYALPNTAARRRSRCADGACSYRAACAHASTAVTSSSPPSASSEPSRSAARGARRSNSTSADTSRAAGAMEPGKATCSVGGNTRCSSSAVVGDTIRRPSTCRRHHHHQTHARSAARAAWPRCEARRLAGPSGGWPGRSPQPDAHLRVQQRRRRVLVSDGVAMRPHHQQEALPTEPARRSSHAVEATSTGIRRAPRHARGAVTHAKGQVSG